MTVDRPAALTVAALRDILSHAEDTAIVFLDDGRSVITSESWVTFGSGDLILYTRLARDEDAVGVGT